MLLIIFTAIIRMYIDHFKYRSIVTPRYFSEFINLINIQLQLKLLLFIKVFNTKYLGLDTFISLFT